MEKYRVRDVLSVLLGKFRLQSEEVRNRVLGHRKIEEVSFWVYTVIPAFTRVRQKLEHKTGDERTRRNQCDRRNDKETMVPVRIASRKRERERGLYSEIADIYVCK